MLNNTNYEVSNYAIPRLLLHSEVQNSAENSVLEHFH